MGNALIKEENDNIKFINHVEINEWDFDIIKDNAGSILLMENLPLIDIYEHSTAIFIDTTGKSSFVIPYSFYGTLIYLGKPLGMLKSQALSLPSKNLSWSMFCFVFFCFC